jgi:alkylation response protein AidB-like acyl-CoA dehydrogenase
MDFSEPEEIALLRAAVGGIARRYGHPYFVEAARSGRKTDELWAELAGHGFLSVNLPAEYGGGGMGLSELAVVTEETAAAGCPILLLLVSPAICGTLLAQFGTVEQQERWLRPLGEGKAKMAFALTEPDAGSNSHRLATVATSRADGGYVLNGTKHYISGVDEADAMLVVTRSGSDEHTGRARLSLFIVDTVASGLERVPMQVELVLPEKQFVLFFDDVEVSADRLLGVEGDGLRMLFQGLNPERILGAALLNGIGRYALERAAAYANERSVWGVPIGAHQGLAHPLAEAKIDVELARLMTSKAAWLFDRGADAGEASNMAKYAAAEAALAALDHAIQTHGGNGMATEFGLATLWGLARLLRIAPVSREMILNFVAQHSLGLPRSY